MKSGKIAVFGLILAAAMVSAVSAMAEISIGGGIEGYMPSSRPHVIIMPAAQPAAAVKAPGEAAADLAKAVQPATAAVVAEAGSAVKEAGKKAAVAPAVKAGKKALGRRKKSRIASGAAPAPKTAAPVSVS